jgi:saccharopine dehydrogenase (NAD+, L-lysine-forming)
VDIVAIDHLPTMLPLESSMHFAEDLLPTIEGLAEIGTHDVWQRAIKLFETRMAESKL